MILGPSFSLRCPASSPSEMKKVNAKKVEAVRHQVNKFKFAFSIVDTTEIEESKIAAFVDYCNASLSDQFKAGLEYVALLKPKNQFAASALSEAVKVLSFKPMLGIHESFERALQHTTQLWSGKLGHSSTARIL
jgi:hypothetical protein